VINYSCDRCRCPLKTPASMTPHSIPTILEAKMGVELLLPNKNSVGYSFTFTHLCETCLGELSAWKTAKMVDHTMADDR